MFKKDKFDQKLKEAAIKAGPNLQELNALGFGLKFPRTNALVFLATRDGPLQVQFLEQSLHDTAWCIETARKYKVVEALQAIQVPTAASLSEPRNNYWRRADELSDLFRMELRFNGVTPRGTQYNACVVIDLVKDNSALQQVVVEAHRHGNALEHAIVQQVFSLVAVTFSEVLDAQGSLTSAVMTREVREALEDGSNLAFPIRHLSAAEQRPSTPPKQRY